MSLEKDLYTRSGGKCELCEGKEGLNAYLVSSSENENSADAHVLACQTCHFQLSNPSEIEINHWRCLNDSMWSEIPAVQVMAWRVLNYLKKEGWTQDLLDTLYLDEEILAWAQAGQAKEEKIVHKDSHGAVLENGDTVVITKTLNVKGSSVTAKRGTAVRNISLVWDNPEHIEGRVDGQQIVILTKYVKKSK